MIPMASHESDIHKCNGIQPSRCFILWAYGTRAIVNNKGLLGDSDNVQEFNKEWLHSPLLHHQPSEATFASNTGCFNSRNVLQRKPSLYVPLLDMISSY